MSIASKLTLLQQDITNARTAITTKGGTVTTGGGSSQLATDIATIPSGVTPTGTISITSNGTHDVTNYASANVNVPAKKWGVSVDNYWRTSAKATPDLEDFVLNASTLPDSMAYSLQYAGLKSVTITGNIPSTISYSYSRMFRCNDNLESVVLDCTIPTIYNYILANAFDSCGITTVLPPYTNPYTTFTMYCASITGSYSLSYMFSNAKCFKYFAFPITTKINSTGYNVFKNAFANCYQCYIQGAGINIFRFPVLTQIGGTTTSIYAAFNTAFWCSVHATYHYGELIFPELTIISCRNSTASNGHFNSCVALNKVYLPKFNSCNASTSGTTYSRYLFNNCTNISELHFGIENQATIEAMDGYATKFGATNATLYFDMPNHITVDGTVYDRSGAEYDYDNSYYSWKNGAAVIYTTNAINPAVGDAVYTKNGTTYTASGTIGAIA